MKSTIRMRWFKIIISVIVVVTLCLIFRNNYEEIIGCVTGYFIAMIGSEFLAAFWARREDKNKISAQGFHYDAAYYRRILKFGDKETCIWYEPFAHDANPSYVVKDSPSKHFQLDPILQTNYASILQAHAASYIANPPMVRLDDFTYENDCVTLHTSRTLFFNDLVTNRSMDYRFQGNLTVREIYESGRYLSPLAESKMSNHIGYGAFVFYDDAMFVCCRGGTATISKNKLTAALAFGLAEDDIAAAHACGDDSASEPHPVMTKEDLFVGIMLVRLSDVLDVPLPYLRAIYAEGKLHIHTLGFGRLIYTGGKPQFYFAIVIDREADLEGARLRHRKVDTERIDYNKDVLSVRDISLCKAGGYRLALKLKGSEKVYRSEAEKSFFINYWHLLVRDRIAGVPDWVYRGGTAELSPTARPLAEPPRKKAKA